MAILPPDPVYLIRGNMGPVHSLLFRISPYFDHLYAGTESGKVHIWDLRRNRELHKLEIGKEACEAIRLMSDEVLAIQNKGGAVEVWNANGSKWTLDRTFNSEYCGFCRCQILSEDVLLIPLPNSNIGALSLKTLNVEYKLDPSQLPDPKSLGEIMLFKPLIVEDNQLLLVAYESGDLALWDIKARNVLSWMKIESCPMSLDFDGTLMRGIVGCPTDKLQMFDLSKSHVLSARTSLTLKNPGTSVLATRPDSKVFTAGGWDGCLRIFSWKTLRPLVVLNQHRGTIHDIIYSSSKVEAYDSKCLMAAASKDGNVSLWDLYNN